MGNGERWLKRLGLGGGVLAFALLALVPSGLHRVPGAGSRPAYAAAVASLMALWWLTEAVPINWTACLPLLLFPLLGVFGKGFVGDAQIAVSPFLDAYIFLFLGGMAIGAAMEEWSLHRRVALQIMGAIGTAPQRLLLGMLVSTAAVSLWISNTATAVMMLPIALAVLRQLETSLGGRRLTHFGGALMLSVAYGSNIGGIGTKIGTGTNSIFCGFVSEKLHFDIAFLPYMAAALPFVLLFIPLTWLILWREARRDDLGEAQGKEVLQRELAALGPMSSQERTVAIVFAAAALLWILGDPLKLLFTPLALSAGFKLAGKHVEATVAMGAALALLATRTLSLSGLKRLPWGTLLLLGGSFAMAAGLEGSGLSSWMSSHLTALATLPPLAQILVTSVATVMLSAVASNTATVNVMLNLLPRSMPLLFATTIASSCDFALPAGTPPNAIVFGSGYVRLPTMMRIGFLLDLLAAVIVALYSHFWIRLIFP